MDENNDKKEHDENKLLDCDIAGANPIGTLIFTIVLTIVMYFVSKLLN